MKTYEDGLNEAWEAARKIMDMNPIELGELIGIDTAFESDIINKYSASEAIDRIKKYERINVGDEVTDNDGWEGVVTWISPDPDGEYLIILQKDGTALHWKKNIFKKTGRHFSEIAEVLKQMQEGNE